MQSITDDSTPSSSIMSIQNDDSASAIMANDADNVGDQVRIENGIPQAKAACGNSSICCTLSQGKVCICDQCEMQRALLKLSSSATSSVSSSSAPSSLRKRKLIDDGGGDGAATNDVNNNGTDGAAAPIRPADDVHSTPTSTRSSTPHKTARLKTRTRTPSPAPSADLPLCLPISTSPTSDAERLSQMTAACRTILTCIGEDPRREGLLKTPDRWAKALLFFTSGYALTPAAVTNGALFHLPPPNPVPPLPPPDGDGSMVVLKDIDVHSLCEHHMVPFTGKVHVGYIPGRTVVGLSKLARMVEVYARRLQVQERLTGQVADAVEECCEPRGVAVMVECRHFCMVMRGVEKCGAGTVSTSYRGSFRGSSALRAEFMSLVGRRCLVAS